MDISGRSGDAFTRLQRRTPMTAKLLPSGESIPSCHLYQTGNIESAPHFIPKKQNKTAFRRQLNLLACGNIVFDDRFHENIQRVCKANLRILLLNFCGFCGVAQYPHVSVILPLIEQVKAPDERKAGVSKFIQWG